MKRLTGTQKTAIRNLRSSGLGYKSIAERLSLSRETVRSFCVRNSVPTGMARQDVPCAEATRPSEMKIGNTVFIISTGNSEKATEPLEKKLETLILDAAAKQSRSYHFVHA
jgi:orotate phosphoribosyltransferase-like protein